jgi:DNA-binding transcriptional LysR family regulator
MTLVQLRHLIALAESGSFTQSAEALCITQPALSRSVQALEKELGQPLFDRTGRRSELTPFGREVVQRARQLVFEADELVASGRQMSAGQAGAVRLGLGSGPSAILSTPLLRTAATRHPGLRLDIVRGPIENLVQALRERQLDALVIDARSLPPAPDLRVTAVTELRGAFLCRPDHPLTRWKRALRFAALQQYPIASTPLSDEVARVLVERYGRAAHPAGCVTLRSEDIPALVDVARNSDTVVLAIRAAAPDFIELPLQPALNFTARFGVVTLAGRSEAPAMPLVRKLVQEFLHD